MVSKKKKVKPQHNILDGVHGCTVLQLGARYESILMEACEINRGSRDVGHPFKSRRGAQNRSNWTLRTRVEYAATRNP